MSPAPSRCFSWRFPDGGEGGIRTPDTVARMPHFECGAFNHSATSPEPDWTVERVYLSNAARANKSVESRCFRAPICRIDPQTGTNRPLGPDLLRTGEAGPPDDV